MITLNKFWYKIGTLAVPFSRAESLIARVDVMDSQDYPRFIAERPDSYRTCSEDEHIMVLIMLERLGTDA